MGGGATVKAMNKVVGIGIVNSGFPVSAAAGRVLRRPSSPITTTSKADPVKPAVVEPIDDTLSAQKSVSAFDDWDFANIHVEDVVVSLSDDDGKVSPRSIVLGGVPTLDEAKAATSQLVESVSQRFGGSSLSSPVSPRFRGSSLSSPVSPRFGGSSLSSPVSPRFRDSSLSSPVSPRFGLSSCFQNPEEQPWGSIVTTDAVVQAFKLLAGNKNIQKAVVALASDPNLLKTVYDNEEVKRYVRSEKDKRMNPHSQTDESSDTDDDDDDDDEYNLEDEMILYIWKSTKVAVVDMLEKLSLLFSNLFGDVLSTGKDSAETCSLFEKALGPSLMGLVILVIMVVFMNRTS